MTAQRPVPHNDDAERALLGAMLLSKDAIAEAATIAGAGDFHRPAHATIYDALVRLWRNGEPNDPVSVAALLEREGTLASVGGPATLVTLQAATPATTSAGRYARLIVDAAGRRRLMGVALDIADRVAGAEDLADLVDAARAALGEIDLPLAKLPEHVWSVDQFLARPEEKRPPWIIPGLYRPGWRVVLVAEEGVGKTELAHQLALAAAQGIHPFAGTSMPRIGTLLCDFENPDERIVDGFERVTAAVKRADYMEHQAWLWHEEGGINVRQRADRGRLEAVIAAVQPQLVCIGPIYKLYAKTSRETDEDAARECMAVLDDLRSRYGFGLFLEHHAPKKQAGVREMSPYGSSFWLRWPEFGLSLTRDPERNSNGQNEHYLIGRFRHDRVKASWPSRLSRSKGGLPWSAAWPDDRWRRDVGLPPTTPPPRHYTDDDDEEF